MKLDVQKQSEFKTVFQFVQNALDTNSTEEEIEENEHETNRSQKAQFHKERYIAQHPCETLQQVREFVGHIYESDDIDRAVMSHPYVLWLTDQLHHSQIQVQELTRKYNRQSNLARRRQSRIVELKDLIYGLCDRIKQEERLRLRTEEEFVCLSSKIGEQNQEIEYLRQNPSIDASSEILNKYSKAVQKIRQLQQESSEKEKKLTDRFLEEEKLWKSKYSALLNKLKSLQNQNDPDSPQVQHVLQQLDAANEKIQYLEKKIMEKEAIIEKSMQTTRSIQEASTQSIVKAQEAVDSIQQQLQLARERHHQTEQQLELAQEEISRLRIEIRRLEIALDVQSRQLSHSRANAAPVIVYKSSRSQPRTKDQEKFKQDITDQIESYDPEKYASNPTSLGKNNAYFNEPLIPAQKNTERSRLSVENTDSSKPPWRPPSFYPDVSNLCCMKRPEDIKQSFVSHSLAAQNNGFSTQHPHRNVDSRVSLSLDYEQQRALKSKANHSISRKNKEHEYECELCGLAE